MHHKAGGGEAPLFAIGGTAYPSAHEPDNCNTTMVPGGAYVEITGADKTTLRLSVNSVGNFFARSRGTTIALPYTAKIVAGGKERIMVTAQKNGDCNRRHTLDGAMADPGRIMLP